MSVRLPPPPEYALPVEVREPVKGETLAGIAARERSGRVSANQRITEFREWYDSVREAYKGQ